MVEDSKSQTRNECARGDSEIQASGHTTITSGPQDATSGGRDGYYWRRHDERTSVGCGGPAG